MKTYYIKFRGEHQTSGRYIKWSYAGISDYEQTEYFLVNINTVYENLQGIFQTIYKSSSTRDKYMWIGSAISAYINTNLISIEQKQPEEFYSEVGKIIMKMTEENILDISYFN